MALLKDLSVSTLISVGAILISIGIWYMTTNENTHKIDMLTEKVHGIEMRLSANEKDIVSIKKDIEFIRINTLEMRSDIKKLLHR